MRGVEKEIFNTEVFDLETDIPYLENFEEEILSRGHIHLPNFKPIHKIKSGQRDGEYESIKKPKKYQKEY